MIKKIILTVFVLIPIQLLFFSDISKAYNQKIVPSIGIKETYDTKVGYEDEDDFIHSIIPSLKYTLSDDNTNIFFNGLIDISFYSKLHDYNGVDQIYLLDVDHNLTENIVIGIKNNFMYDNNSKKSFEYTGEDINSSDRIIYGISPYITLDINETTRAKCNYKISEINYQGYSYNDDYSDSITNSFGASIEHDLSERITMGLATSADLRSYDKDDAKNHYDHYKISLLTRYRLSERTKLRLSISGDQYYENEVNDDSDTTQTANVSAGATHEISERLKLDIFLGTGDQTTFDESGALGAELTWIGETWKLSGGYKKDITSGARGYDLKRDKIFATGEYKVSEKTLLGFRGGYVYSNEIDNDEDDEEKYTYYSMEPYLQYEIVKNSFITASYNYGVYMDRDEDNSITRNQIYIMYTITFPSDK
ncbi:MAG: hypothetical protein WCR47_09170 [Desulfoplanes sp.]